MKTYRLTGNEAIRIAERDGVTLRKHADPVDGARDVTVGEARQIAREDAGLLFVEVEPSGWVGAVNDAYHAGDYFDGQGYYLGPDIDGVEPTWRDAA